MFQRGDILRGSKRARTEAWHPIVYLDGPEEAPLAVMLTHTDNVAEPCNVKIEQAYIRGGLDGREQYFVAHRLQKLSEWAPYKKVGELTNEGIDFVESQLPAGSLTWDEYEKLTKNGCQHHK